MEALKFNGIALALSFLAVLLLFLFSLGRPNEICYSKGGRFPPYALDGKAPEKASDLTFCRIFSGKTCCNSEQTHSTLLSAGKIAFECKSNYECVNLWQFLECSICDPKIGVQRGAPLICSSFCDRIFRACPDAYFARDGPDLKPCGSQSLVCAKVSSLFSDGTELCNAAGFSVLPDDPGKPEQSEKYCYGSEVVDSYHNPWQSSQKWRPEKSEQAEETIGKTFYEDAPSRVTKSKASAEDTPSRGTKGKASTEDTPSRVTKGKASTEDTPSRVTKSEASSEDTPSRVRKSEASTEDTPSRLEKSMVLRKHVLYQAWKFFHDSIVYCTLGLAGLAAWLFFLRFMKGDPSIEKAKSCLSSINKADAEPKKKNRRSQKKKNG